MKNGVILVNTSRGGLLDTQSLLSALRNGKVAAAGLDVYEGEKEYFFENKSNEVIKDNVLTQLLSMNNVLITSHMSFLTEEALTNISTSVWKCERMVPG